MAESSLEFAEIVQIDVTRSPPHFARGFTGVRIVMTAEDYGREVRRLVGFDTMDQSFARCALPDKAKVTATKKCRSAAAEILVHVRISHLAVWYSSTGPVL